MIKEKKFLSLKATTQLKKIADEAKIVRDNILNNENYSLETLHTYATYLEKNNNELYLKIASICKKDGRELLEDVHFLYNYLLEKIGRPVPESQFVQITGDRKNFDIKRNDVILVLDNLQSAFNVGSIVRLSDAFGVKKIYFLGRTPFILHEKVKKTAKDADKHISCEQVSDIETLFSKLKFDGYTIWGVETGLTAVSIYDAKFDNKTAIVMGNEEIGISQKVVNLCDNIVEIPMKGFKNSINVSNACSVILYEYSRQVDK